jgi:hypothetical protein
MVWANRKHPHSGNRRGRQSQEREKGRCGLAFNLHNMGIRDLKPHKGQQFASMLGQYMTTHTAHKQ